MIPFFQEIIYVSIGIAGFIFLIRRECKKDMENIEGELGHEWYLIQSHIWGSDIKNKIKDLYIFIESERRKFIDQGSEDPLSDLFSESESLVTLRSRLNELHSSYNDYLTFKNILSKFAEINSVLNKWIDRAIITTLFFTLWGMAGLFIELNQYQSDLIKNICWSVFYFLLVFTAIIIYKAISYYRKTGEMKDKVRVEKSRYSEIIERLS